MYSSLTFECQHVKLRYVVPANGKKRQSELLNDMIFTVTDAIEFPTWGQALMPGHLIFIVTPSDVGMANGNWIQNGVVECSWIVGSVINKFISKDYNVTKLKSLNFSF